jgi:hypothetical protein
LSKELLVFGEKTFKITIPDGAKVTFGPWSPPTGGDRYANTDKALNGTLRVYAPEGKSTENILAVFSGVKGFRETSLGYAEMVAREEGAILWNSDSEGYTREEKVKTGRDWVQGGVDLLETKPESQGDEVKF